MGHRFFGQPPKKRVLAVFFAKCALCSCKTTFLARGALIRSIAAKPLFWHAARNIASFFSDRALFFHFCHFLVDYSKKRCKIMTFFRKCALYSPMATFLARGALKRSIARGHDFGTRRGKLHRFLVARTKIAWFFSGAH